MEFFCKNMPRGRKKSPRGRKKLWKDVKTLQKKIDNYFASCWDVKTDMFGKPVCKRDHNGKLIKDKKDKPIPVLTRIKPYTITGLAVFLETSRETLCNYEKDDEFFDTIKRAKERCHAFAEESLFTGKQATGAIFNLKNNYGWRDEFDFNNVNQNIDLSDEQYKKIIKREAGKLEDGDEE